MVFVHLGDYGIGYSGNILDSIIEIPEVLRISQFLLRMSHYCHLGEFVVL
jgi:hypothetical protein